MAELTPNPDAFAAMSKSDPDAPVVMLNLLRFRDSAASGQGVDGLSGRDAYMEYVRRFSELGPSHGGKLIWMGDALNTIIGNERWDLVLLVRYPTRRQFVAMLSDRAYQKIASIRQAALADSRLVEMSERTIPF